MSKWPVCHHVVHGGGGVSACVNAGVKEKECGHVSAISGQQGHDKKFTLRDV